MTWTPISQSELADNIARAHLRMTVDQQAFWAHIAIQPEKWTQHPYGTDGDGFWVAAIVNDVAIWYNDIEDGWNSSKFSTPGRFHDYWCNQDQLEWVVEELMTGNARPKAGPPQNF